MNNDFKNAVKGWLEAIMPSVAATIADVLTPEALRECAKEEAVHGPYTINIDELNGPVKAIAFHVVVVNEIAMFAVNATIRNNEDFSSAIKFDIVFSCDEFLRRFWKTNSLPLLFPISLFRWKKGTLRKNRI